MRCLSKGNIAMRILTPEQNNSRKHTKTLLIESISILWSFFHSLLTSPCYLTYLYLTLPSTSIQSLSPRNITCQCTISTLIYCWVSSIQTHTYTDEVNSNTKHILLHYWREGEGSSRDQRINRTLKGTLLFTFDLKL